MARSKSDASYEAILFMQEHRVTKQMKYGELEALLDGVVGLRELADTEMTLVFVEIDRQLHIQSLVFFLLYFDETGRADPEWNLPLRQLAKTASSGPDMGGGPIRLCCRSQCPISWHQKDMWDPSMKPGANDFQAIKRAVEENRFGFEVEKPEPVSSVKAKPAAGKSRQKEEVIPTLDESEEAADEGLVSGLSAEHRIKIARAIRSQRLRIKTLIGKHKEELAETIRQRRIEAQTLKNELQAHQQRLEHIKVMNEQLKTANEQLKTKLDQRNEQFLALQDQLAEAKKALVAMEERVYKADSSAKETSKRTSDRLEAELVILKEQLDRRDVELFYRDEREQQYKAEIEALKESLGNAGAQSAILQQLADLDVVFVVYHPGAGHITIQPRDVERYVANPMAYAAEKCFVTEAQYRAWLEHYENPQCQFKLPNGDLCGEVVQRVSQPSEFVAGEHNRCSKHRR